MSMMSKLRKLRRGRPAKVKLNGIEYVVNVKGQAYRFVDVNGHLRPRDTVNGNKADRDYAKQLVKRRLDEVL